MLVSIVTLIDATYFTGPQNYCASLRILDVNLEIKLVLLAILENK